MEASDLAVYALVFNLGSLVARFVFQPIEETAFAVFGKLNDIAGKMDSQNKDHHLSVGALVGTLCKTMCIIGLTFVTFGPSYSHLLLHLLYGNKWSNQTDAPRALGVYCVYVLIIAVNGITEAFVHAIGDKKSLQDFNAWLFLFSLIYLGAAAVLLPFRAVGLILANCINMGMRILFSTNFILKWEDPVSKQRVDSIRQLCPSLQTLFAFSSSAVAVSVSETTVYHAFASWPRAGAHVAIGAVALVSTFAFLVFVSEKKYVANLRDLRRALAGKSG
uniref:Protein RFT1 homolog n=2 Tax=Mucochytrium quahogii TaxID=96639 RepID=A0A7S2RDF7_9STRA